MSFLREKSDCLLSTTAGVDMATTTTKRVLYTPPAGKFVIITKIVVRNASATLGTNYAFGTTATCNDWKTAINLSSMTGVTHIMTIVPVATILTIAVADATVGMYITTGAAGGTTATIDVFGYVV